MIKIGMLVAILLSSVFAQAAKFDCRKVESTVYGHKLDGAYVDPVKGVFISYIQDVGGGYELFEPQVSAFSDGNFDRQADCEESRKQSGSKTIFSFMCQSGNSALEMKSVLFYDSSKKSGFYKGSIKGGTLNKFRFNFSECL